MDGKKAAPSSRQPASKEQGECRWIKIVCAPLPCTSRLFTLMPERKGFVFKTGDQGLGYYSETPAVWRGKAGYSHGMTWFIDKFGASFAQVNLGKRHAPLHILQCDMFDVTPDLLAASTFATDGRFDLIYDRDALGALPPDSWAQYAQRLGSLLRVGQLGS
eukprot:g9077.t1